MPKHLEAVFNVDSFLRYMAVMVTVSSWDYYPYTGNNFYLYNNPGTNRFEWIPWDQTWGGDPSMPLYEIEGFGLMERAPLTENIFKVPRYRQKFAAYVDLLSRQWFNYENIYQQSANHHQLIAPYVSQSTGDKAFFGETAWFRTTTNLKTDGCNWRSSPEIAANLFKRISPRFHK